MSTGNRWSVVQTPPNRETRAKANLRQRGYLTYLPCTARLRRHADNIEPVPGPMLSGYLFIALDPARGGWRSIRATFGAPDIVNSGEEPVRLPVGVIDDIRTREGDDGPRSHAQRGAAAAQQFSLASASIA